MSSYHDESASDSLFKAQRKTYLDRYSFCRICDSWTPRKDRSIDHIIPMWRYDGVYWDKTNWQMLCLHCARKKTRIEGSPEV